MNKLKTIMAACAACALTSTAMAADPDGTINFTGEIISGSCKVIGAGTGNSVPVDLGRVLISDIETAGAVIRSMAQRLRWSLIAAALPQA